MLLICAGSRIKGSIVFVNLEFYKFRIILWMNGYNIVEDVNEFEG